MVWNLLSFFFWFPLLYSFFFFYYLLFFFLKWICRNFLFQFASCLILLPFFCLWFLWSQCFGLQCIRSAPPLLPFLTPPNVIISHSRPAQRSASRICQSSGVRLGGWLGLGRAQLHGLAIEPRRFSEAAVASAAKTAPKPANSSAKSYAKQLAKEEHNTTISRQATQSHTMLQILQVSAVSRALQHCLQRWGPSSTTRTQASVFPTRNL